MLNILSKNKHNLHSFAHKHNSSKLNIRHDEQNTTNNNITTYISYFNVSLCRVWAKSIVIIPPCDSIDLWESRRRVPYLCGPSHPGLLIPHLSGIDRLRLDTPRFPIIMTNRFVDIWFHILSWPIYDIPKVLNIRKREALEIWEINIIRYKDKQSNQIKSIKGTSTKQEISGIRSLPWASSGIKLLSPPDLNMSRSGWVYWYYFLTFTI